MGREDDDIRAAKLGYKEAARDGNHEEEARWANLIGDILKRRGEYVEALRWLRIDYEVSAKYLPQKQLLATCQSLGEVYLRLERFKEALLYQKKHLELANDTNDIIEQQRASTQLGRTYYEVFLRSENDHHAIRSAKKYFKLAMKLARSLKETPPPKTDSFFLKEYINAHNNIGMLEMDIDNLEEAEKMLLKGLMICDEEEVNEYDDGRTRLHHNLGNVYLELREWNKARTHIEKDILICRRIGHPQGEVKGFINLGELHYRVQKYDEAILCYQKAMDIAKSMEDEDSLVDHISQNVKTVNEASKVLELLIKDEQKLKRLMRATSDARGTANERKFLLEQNVFLDSLIEKSCMIFAWPKHQEFAKRKKRVATELCDKKKLGDSFLDIGESYQKLRNFGKARKWYMKSWNAYRSIGNLEGQALAKINVGEVLDSSGDWTGALEAFEEGYRISVKANLLSVQLSALDNMHYSHMIRFDNVDEARKLQIEIQNVKRLLNESELLMRVDQDYCSETETEGVVASLLSSDESDSLEINNPSIFVDKPNIATGDAVDDDVPLRMLVKKCKKSSKMEMPSLNKKAKMSDRLGERSNRDLINHDVNHQSLGRKRVRVIISDEEDEELDQATQLRKRNHGNPIEDVATSCGDIRLGEIAGPTAGKDLVNCNASKDKLDASTPIQIAESACSLKSKSSKSFDDNVTEFGSASNVEISNATKSMACGSKLHVRQVPSGCLEVNSSAGHTFPVDDHGWSIMFKAGHDSVYVDMNCCLMGNILDVDYLKVEVACAFFLGLFEEKRSKGLVPVIHRLVCSGKILRSQETIEDMRNLLSQKVYIEVVIGEWVPKRLMKLYMDFCDKLTEATSNRLLKKLFNLEVSEDEVIVSDCALQDASILSFLHALEAHKSVALLDISHNSLGNETMEKIQQIFTSSNQKYGGLTLDLHCNRFGPTALFQICECPVMFKRLEVLNLAQNRLTDACSSYLSTILENCKALYNLNIEQCSLTSRTIQKLSDFLHDGSILSHLSIGKNNPISGNTMVNLLSKLLSLKRFSELSLTGIKLNKTAVEGLCQLPKSSSLSALFLGETCIGADGAVRLTEVLSCGAKELEKLDLATCGITSDVIGSICANIVRIDGIVELNLRGNSIGDEGCYALECMLLDPQCSVKSLILDRCHLGLSGILRIVIALAGNESLEELHLARNANIANERALEHHPKSNKSATVCSTNETCRELEVADSEDDKDSKDGASDRSPSICSRLISELSVGIDATRHLQFLDLSENKLSSEAIESLYSSWSSARSRSSLEAYKHQNEDQILHFCVVGRRCCGVRSCCRKD
ncbi:protein TONSOKU isoform X2 [Phalaenopsis equestris]|uniref:protein TONSOKU isoform X2 n=1 Tax=Phalaenopsis equestris TaxID=78828 RepID=UPI0009E49B16|nr:protein TONSOKU isoform X2 [Phalaenopsis equestris]